MAVNKINPKSLTVAKVNAEELDESQLEEAVTNYRESLKEQGIDIRVYGQEQLHNVRQFMLTKLVEREVLHQEAVRKKLKVSKEEIDRVLEETEKQYPSRKAFLDDILKGGKTIEDYRERLAYDMMVNKLAAQRYEERKTPLSKDAIYLFYQNNRQLFAQQETVRIGHILIKVSQDADNKEWEKAKKKLGKLRESKKDFRQLAQEHSECSSGKEGGDLGIFTQHQLSQPLAIAAFRLRAGEISAPVESSEGMHLIKLYERRPRGYVPAFDEIKNQVEQLAKTEQAQKIYQDYIEELKSKASIKVF
jgi:parvulin-like peptidyl-prolyl isomerase